MKVAAPTPPGLVPNRLVPNRLAPGKLAPGKLALPAGARPDLPRADAGQPDWKRARYDTIEPDIWPRPPASLPACLLMRPPEGARVTVSGLVILRQRPGTARGVVFLTLEDETGVVNVIVWRDRFKQFRRAAISGRMLRVTGRIQRAHGVAHVIAEQVEDISELLDRLLQPAPLSPPRPAEERARTPSP